MKSILIALFAGIVACAPFQPAPAADAVTYKEKVLWSFGSSTDGRYPSSLIAVNGVLYGTTSGGGQGCNGNGCGVVFSIDPATGTEKVLYSFCSKANCADGAIPAAGLINFKGMLYGTTEIGGAVTSTCSNGCGTVFSFDPSTGTETVVYAFCLQEGCADGALPTASLTAEGGELYGTTESGGTQSGGTVFSLAPDTGVETMLHSFCSQQNCADGYVPYAGVIAMHGVLYGTTAYGGAAACTGSGCGTVFSVDPKTGVEAVLHSFLGGADGQQPFDGLTNLNGTLYGTTFFGGQPGCLGTGCGTVFSLDPSTGAESVLYAFCQEQNCPDGALPSARLIAAKGTLYGTTAYGGRTGCPQTGNCGTAFSVDPDTGVETVLYAFCSEKKCKDGWGPDTSLTAVHGKLYGTTKQGGAYGYGVAFALIKAR